MKLTHRTNVQLSFLVSCAAVQKSDATGSGIYSIDPDSKGPMNVFCDMTTDGGGWTVIQWRVDSSTDFFLNWASYKQGFGSLNGNLWLGNDNIHRLTASGSNVLRVELEDWNGNIVYAVYGTFEVDDESNKYRLTVGAYSGTAGDSLGGNNGSYFSTKDKDNDHLVSNCEKEKKGAWWYSECTKANLNGRYRGKTIDSDWIKWEGIAESWEVLPSFKRCVMKIRRSFSAQ